MLLIDTIVQQELLELGLQGPPGPPGPAGTTSPPVSSTFTWAAGRLASVAYADGRSKVLTYTGEQLTRVDHARPGLPTLRADLSYHPDGTLAVVAQSEV